MENMSGGDMLRLAAAGIGAVRLGIPVDAVVQAIPVPAAPVSLPRRRGALRAVVQHAGSLVPVVDLARWVDVGTPGASGQAGERILILHAAGRTIGLQVDTVDGLVDVPHAAVARLHHDDAPEEVFHSAVQVPESGQILSLLDVGRLADLAASWHQADDALATPAAAQAPAASPLDPAGALHALLQLDGVRLGVPASDLVEVMPMPALTRFGGGIDGAYCLWRGRHLPVLGAAALPGLPDACTAPLLAVVEHEGLVLGLPAHAALALQALAGGGAGLISTVYGEDGGECKLLDTTALFERFPEAHMSRAKASADTLRTSRAAQDAGTANHSAYVVFDAGTLCATPIAGIEQILPLPPDCAASATMPWRGAAMTLHDLRPGGRGAAAQAEGHVLVVVEDGKPVGYVVTRVELLVPSGSGTLYRLGADPARAVEFVTVDAAGGQASYRIVDLARARPS